MHPLKRGVNFLNNLRISQRTINLPIFTYGKNINVWAGMEFCRLIFAIWSYFIFSHSLPKLSGRFPPLPGRHDVLRDQPAVWRDHGLSRRIRLFGHISFALTAFPSCPAGSYLCRDGMTCYEISQRFDGTMDCPDVTRFFCFLIQPFQVVRPILSSAGTAWRVTRSASGVTEQWTVPTDQSIWSYFIFSHSLPKLSGRFFPLPGRHDVLREQPAVWRDHGLSRRIFTDTCVTRFLYFLIQPSQVVRPVPSSAGTEWRVTRSASGVTVPWTVPTDQMRDRFNVAVSDLVRNRCVIELFCGVVFVVTLPFWHFYWCRGFCQRTESDLFLSSV